MRRLILVVVVLVPVGGCGSKKHAREDAPTQPVDAAIAKQALDAATPDAPPAQPARSEHPVFDLVDNRHAAHRFVDGELVLDGAHVSFARYTRFSVPVPRWKIGATVDGKRVAIPDKLAALEVPLTIEQARTSVQLTVRVHASDEKMALELKINGRKASKDARIELAVGWQTIALAIDPGRLAVGENHLGFTTSAPRRKHKDRKLPAARLAIEWLRLGAARAPTDEDPRRHATFDPKGTITLDRDASLTWFVPLPEGAHLVADLGAPCKLEVRARPSADSFAGGTLAGPSGRVDLTAMGARVVALQLTARDCDRASIIRPRITIVGAAPELQAKAPAPKYIVFWVMDALRADKIPIFSPGARAQTPSFDELAKSAAVFRQYYVQGNESQTSHTSMWTGLYPAVHNVRFAGSGGEWRMDAKYPVIASEAAAAGMYTTAVTGNGFVTPDGGYAKGFKDFRNMMRELGVINGVIYGQKIVDAALKQLDAHRAQPTYLFLGTIDTHGPWIARKPWIDLYSPGPYNGPFKEFGTAKDLGFRPGRMGCSIIPPPDDIERLRAIYDSAVSYQDQQLGRMIAQLKSWGIWDETMLIITADHGEEFFEDERCGHGGSLRDSLTRVPLVIYDPARFPGGTIIEEGAEGVDLLPTIVDALGAKPVDGVQGSSLIPLAQGIGRGWARPSYASQYEYAHTMRIGRWKMIVYKSGIPNLIDFVEDPAEKVDMLTKKPVERRMLTDNLGMFLALRATWKKSAWGVVTNVTAAGAAALDEATTE